ncbi:MAG: tetratricopeptide repeat protein [Candidatus Marinimicrobia bacterium]|mgnify:CR=1 FL=1|nr:tetratricopeptide repeat protein [Candidatus Neomarinimicrobiota bacterium]MDP6610960.1 tetratricopeptide repeat protein [Candidatus Neomarinimicrobiota bacterium]
MKRIWLFLFMGQLLAQTIEVLPEGEAAFVQAMAMERAGNLDGAIQIYQNILAGNPNHQRVYLQLRNIYSRTGNAAAGISMVEAWVNHHPDDLQSLLILGEFYYRNQDHEKALEIWDHFRKTKLTNQTTFRLLFHTYVRFGQVDAMEALTREARERFNEHHFFAIDLANYYQSRQTYDRSLREYLTLIRYQKEYLRYTTDRLLLMSDDTTAHALIDSTLRNTSEEIPDVRYILAGFYYKTGRFENALNEHRQIGVSNPGDSKRWLEFAENLRKEKQYELSIQAYHHLLQNMTKNDPNIIGKALLGLGQTFEEQIVQNKTEMKFVKWFPENEFFQNHIIKAPQIADDLLANTIEHYQSILAMLPPSNTTATVHYRLGEIQSRMIRDLNGAKISYETALQSLPQSDLRKKIRIRLGNLLLSAGQYTVAVNYFGKGRFQNLRGDGIDEFTIGYLNSQLFNREINAPLAFLDSVILALDPNHRYFNDLMEMHDLLVNYYFDGTRDDRTAFESFFQAEALIRQYKISEALETLTSIQESHPDALITPLSTLRMAILLLEFDQPEAALAKALSIENSPLKDQGLALAGEIEERILGNPDKALIHYHRILSECQSSLLIEPVRLHIRKLSQPQES